MEMSSGALVCAIAQCILHDGPGLVNAGSRLDPAGTRQSDLTRVSGHIRWSRQALRHVSFRSCGTWVTWCLPAIGEAIVGFGDASNRDNQVFDSYPLLTSDAHALSVGYAEGREQRREAGNAEQLAAQREFMELSFPMRRGSGAPFYASWRRGFDAGYLGQPSP